MNNIKVVLIILLFTIVSCKEEIVTTTIEENIVPVDVDLQMGFENKSIRVYFNQQISLDARLSGLVPFAGPIAKFSTQLERKSQTIKVQWQSTTSSSGLTFKEDSAIITLTNSPKYFIGLELINDSLKTTVQVTPFLYMY